MTSNINFSATDFSGLRTALWAEGMKDSPTTRIRYKYSATTELVGNNVFFKGGLFTIPANPLGISNDAFDPGIVGYYVIQNVKDAISLGNYETSFMGTWIYNPASQLGFSGTDVTQQDIDDTEPPTSLRLSVISYMEDLLRLDSNVLARNGLNKAFKPVGKTKDNLPPQNDDSKDIREKVR